MVAARPRAVLFAVLASALLLATGGFSCDDDELFVGAGSDDVGLLRFVPLEAGEYEFFCTIANHRQLGMEGRLTVQ